MPKQISRIVAAATVMAAAVSGSAQATVASGTIIGIFGGVQTSGYIANNPTLGAQTYYDTTGTASYTITNSTDPTQGGTPPLQSTGSALIWGDNNGGGGQASILDFFGAPIPSNLNQQFLVGRLTFSNGTSSLASLIFGATISFYANSVSAQNFLGTDTIYITTTSNGYSFTQDADYINICGNQSNICNSSIEAYEASQGGTGVTVDLYGQIVGDPQLYLNQVTLTPGQPATSGFVGNDPAALPEPASVAVLGVGLVGVLARRRRSR